MFLVEALPRPETLKFSTTQRVVTLSQESQNEPHIHSKYLTQVTTVLRSNRDCVKGSVLGYQSTPTLDAA